MRDCIALAERLWGRARHLFSVQPIRKVQEHFSGRRDGNRHYHA